MSLPLESRNQPSPFSRPSAGAISLVVGDLLPQTAGRPQGDSRANPSQGGSSHHLPKHNYDDHTDSLPITDQGNHTSKTRTKRRKGRPHSIAKEVDKKSFKHQTPRPRKKRADTLREIKAETRRFFALDSNASKGEELFKRIFGEGKTDDPLGEWLDRLRIPHHKGRIYTSNTKVTLVTASNVTRDQMRQHLGWTFLSHDLSDKYKNFVGHPDSGYDPEKEFVHDITESVTPRDAEHRKGYVSSDRYITNYIHAEQHRCLPGGEFSVLFIPSEWKEIKDRPVPEEYTLPKQYADFLHRKTDDIHNREKTSFHAASLSAGSTVHSDDQRSSDGTSLSTGSTVYSDGGVIAPLSDDHNGVQSVEDSSACGGTVDNPPDLPEELQEFAFCKGENDYQKTQKAIEMNKRIQWLNLPNSRSNAIAGIYNHLQLNPRTRLAIDDTQSASCIQKEDELCAKGDTTYNWDTTDNKRLEPYIIQKFISFLGCADDATSEGEIEATVGNLLVGIMACKDADEKCNASLPFPPHLRPLGTTPSPDRYIRATYDSLDRFWPESLLPVLVGKECKPKANYSENTCAQLAMTFHGTLVTFILYYLDTRHSLNSPLPHWMFLYGIEYTEYGVYIYTHHPAYKFDEANPSNGRWIFKSTRLSTEYGRAFTLGATERRVQLLAYLFRIRSHSLQVLQHLKRWNRSTTILGTLIKPEISKWQKNVRKNTVKKKRTYGRS